MFDKIIEIFCITGIGLGLLVLLLDRVIAVYYYFARKSNKELDEKLKENELKGYLSEVKRRAGSAPKTSILTSVLFVVSLGIFTMMVLMLIHKISP